ncbi:MAG TPA: hypothetical protein VFG10_10900 [Saprospiraceae bacterium]|nr:hypothetical protein [Saprospiraceae bacterium]
MTFIIFLNLLTLLANNSGTEGVGCVMYPRECGGDWGIGAYFIPPTFELNVYNDTLRNQVATFKTSYSNLFLYNSAGNRIEMEYCDIEYIGSYSLEFLKVKSIKSSRFLKVLWHTYESGMYVDLEELEGKGAIFYTYKDLLYRTNIPDFSPTLSDLPALGINLKRNCLNLRAEPNINSALIYCIPGNDWQQGKSNEYYEMTISEYQGSWAYVDVTFNDLILEKPDGCMGKEKKKLKGWIKAIADNGFPNIWYPVSGN